MYIIYYLLLNHLLLVIVDIRALLGRLLVELAAQQVGRKGDRHLCARVNRYSFLITNRYIFYSPTFR